MRAIVSAADAPQVADGDLVAVASGGVAALASRTQAAPEASEAELRAHDAIARHVHERAPSLPSRFGQLYSDEAALAHALAAQATALAATLGRVGARVEMSITLRWREAGATAVACDAPSGRAYLEIAAARERERREAERIVELLIVHLPVERALIRHHCCPRDGVAAIVTTLVARDEVSALRHSVETFAEHAREVRAQMYGPLPPYSFAS